MKTDARVLVILGSGGDEKVAESCLETLKKLDVGFTVKVASAHRTPDRLASILKDATAAKVVIAFAGHAAHLAGSIAARVLVPVIGVPVASSELQGLDSLLSTAQMPGGIPVACMAIGSAGSKNAACLAAQILALNDAALKKRLEAYRADMAQKVESSSDNLEQKWNI